MRRLLASETRTPMGRERALELEPLTDPRAIQRRLGETRDGRLSLGSSGSPPWENVPDARSTLDVARTPGSICEGPELAALIPLLEAASRLRGYGQSVEPVAPELAGAFKQLPLLTPLRDRLRTSLDEEGTVRDEASPDLARLRRRLRDLRRDIVKTLEGLFQAEGADSTFQDRYVTVRHGRYVLPIRAEAKGRVRGIVHDRSQSGATLFVEPARVVDANNDLVEATRAEESEILRILAALTDALREALPEADALVEGIGRLDLIVARAELAERMAAVEPVMDEGRAVLVRGARHPLLLAQSWAQPGRDVVPVDLCLDADRPLLLVTGPNAGGKTVALKTLGLLVLMAQSGCHLPASEGCRLPVFSQLFAIIGDDQSVAENLSTFSAFVRQLRDILDHVDGRSLVLLDELGAGTDPDDGAALARAVLEELAERRAFCMASTHLEPLKGFAGTHPRARNASVEFDPERLMPTFRLVYDRPGQSYALHIGARLGLPPALIERAQSYRSTRGQELQALLSRLETSEREQASLSALIEGREAQSAGLLARAQAELEAARVAARELVSRAKADAQRLLGEIRRAVNEEWDRLRREERTRESLEGSRRRLSGLGPHLARLDDVTGSGGATKEPAVAGDRVEVAHLGLRGEVTAVDGSNATVSAGAVTVKVPLRGLRVLQRGISEPAQATTHAHRRIPSAVRVPDKAELDSEIHLIGRTTGEARDLLEKYLDDAFLAGLPSVRIIHGKGTGALRRAVQELLSGHPLVAEHRAGAPHEGGEGATVAVMRVD